MTHLVDTATSWQTLTLVLVVFGFAPGLVLRLIVLIYPRSDPRRDELIAELYAVPRAERPLWVAEQLEVALCEGAVQRLRELRKRRRTLPMAAAGVAVLVIAFTAVGLVAKSTEPDDQLWSLTKVLYSDYSRSVGSATQADAVPSSPDGPGIIGGTWNVAGEHR